jgi:thiazole/oxazole-forming peptide maturase SagD family component
MAPSLSRLDLASPLGAELLTKARHLASPEVINVVSRLARIFIVSSPFARGLCCVGGEIALDSDQAAAYGAPRISVTGNGESSEVAFISCLAEAADFLSQIERKGDVEATGSPTALAMAVANGWIANAISDTNRPIDWVRACPGKTGAPALLPADLCLRRAPGRRGIAPPAPLSSGAAAGTSFKAAALRAVLELSERDAVTLWWRGGRRPRGFSLEHPANKAATALFERLRGTVMERRSWLLDITTDLDVPAVAAVSVDPSGQGLSCGFSARLNKTEAACAAVLELCQMEMSAPLANAKRAEIGDGALNDADRRHLRRAAFSTTACDLLFPNELSDIESPAPANDLEDLMGLLAKKDVPVFLFDMTRHDVGVPVVRAVSPALQPFTDAVSTKRLERARAQSGDAQAKVKDVPLM